MNVKTNNVENKEPDTSTSVTTNVLNTITGELESKIPDVSGLDKKRYDKDKRSGTDRKYFTTSDYNKLTKKLLDGHIKENGLVDKSKISNHVKTWFKNKTYNISNTVLNAEQYKIMKHEAFDSNHFCY